MSEASTDGVISQWIVLNMLLFPSLYIYYWMIFRTLAIIHVHSCFAGLFLVSFMVLVKIHQYEFTASCYPVVLIVIKGAFLAISSIKQSFFQSTEFRNALCFCTQRDLIMSTKFGENSHCWSRRGVAFIDLGRRMPTNCFSLGCRDEQRNQFPLGVVSSVKTKLLTPMMLICGHLCSCSPHRA